MIRLLLRHPLLHHLRRLLHPRLLHLEALHATRTHHEIVGCEVLRTHGDLIVW
jgi:hypothetical protein